MIQTPFPSLNKYNYNSGAVPKQIGTAPVGFYRWLLENVCGCYGPAAVLAIESEIAVLR